MMEFSPPILDSADPAELRRLPSAYERVLLGPVDCIIARFKGDPGYPFIDTKLNTRTGEDLSKQVGEVDLFGKETVYAWIQGRAMEALVRHHDWIRDQESIDEADHGRYLEDLRGIVAAVTRRMEEIREKNGGLFFWHDTDGNAFRLDEEGRKVVIRPDTSRTSTSDCFYVRGLAAAAALLEDEDLAVKARALFRKVVADIESGNCYSDQQPFDPKNPVGEVQGRVGHRRMTGIAA